MEEVMQKYSTTQTTTSTVNIQPQNQPKDSINNLVATSVIILPIMLLIGVKTYKTYRAAVLRKQMVMLEKLWHLNVKNKKS